MLIILDRDGVINQDSKDYVKSPDEWQPIPGSLEAIALLNKKGATVVVATNQSGIGRQYYTLNTLSLIHEKMQQAVSQVGGVIDGIYFCPHHPDDNCDCRKPKPGLLMQIKADYPEYFSTAVFIGDSVRDLEAAKQAGIKPVLVRTGNGQQVDLSNKYITRIDAYENLFDFAEQFNKT